MRSADEAGNRGQGHPAAEDDDLAEFLKRIAPSGTEPEALREKFLAYEEVLGERNRQFNLVSGNDLKRLRVRHFRDSLMLLELFPGLRMKSVIDIGSGAGFPGLALAIVRPDARFCLVESNRKKSAFLREMIGRLGLGNCTVICERAEVVGRDPGFREKCDTALARALARPAVALELLLPLVEIEGRVVIWAGGKDQDGPAGLEKVLDELGGAWLESKPYVLPGEPAGTGKGLVLVGKRSPTGERFPRRVGLPQKSPLK